jgi:hypothetical protein
MAEETRRRAGRNRTITLTAEEKARYQRRLLTLDGPVTLSQILDRTICQDLFQIVHWLPAASVDLLFVDEDGVFWERNAKALERRRKPTTPRRDMHQPHFLDALTNSNDCEG